MLKRIRQLLNIVPNTPSYKCRPPWPMPSDETHVVVDPDGNYLISDSYGTYYITDAIRYHDQEIQE